MKRLLALGAVAALSILSLTGCIGDGSTVDKNTNGGAFTEFTYNHSDGRLLDCIRYDKGITCDWAKPKEGSK